MLESQVVTKEEFNGLGGRLTDTKEAFIKCKAENRQKVTALETAITEMAISQTRVFQGQESINVKLATLTGSLKTWGIVAVIVAPVLGAIAAIVLDKAF